MFCPQCGAPAPFRGTTVSLVCEYCNSTIVRTGVDFSLVGRVSALVDSGSPILLGSRGRYKGVPFEVTGRLQVTYARGTWNEWFVEFADGSTGWLADALGQYALLKPGDPRRVAQRVPRFDEIAIGTVFPVDGVRGLVVDKRAAAYRGAEGSLPFEADPGRRFYGVDLRGFAGEFFTLDYGSRGDHREPQPYAGETVLLEALKLHPLRTFSGWPRPTAAGGR